MTIQRFKFQPPPRTTRATKARVELFPMNRGFNPSVDALRLERGEGSFIQNMTLRAGYIHPRSGLSLLDVPVTNRINYAARSFDNTTSPEQFVIISRDSIYRSNDGFNFTQVTGPDVGDLNSDNQRRDEYWDSTNVYDAATRQNLFVFTNGSEDSSHPMIYSTEGTSYVTLDSFLSSGESRAYLVESFDDRLIFFKSVDSKGTLNGTRVRWSVRGDPSDLSNEGSGFEDLFDMSGTGTALVSEEGRLLLMSETEIWQATPRRDAFSFDFDALDNTIGCQVPRSVAKTPAGVFFVGDGLTIYRVSGSVIRPLSRKINQFIQDKINNLTHVWGVYDGSNRSYWLFFSEDLRSTFGTGTDQAIEIYIDTLKPQNDGTDDFEFVFHRFAGFNFTSGAQFFGSGDWTQATRGESSLLVCTSGGTVLQFRSDQTVDAVTPSSNQTFAAIWQSPKFRSKDPNTKEAISEVWFDTGFETMLGKGNQTPIFSSRTATLQFYTSIDQGATFSNVGSVSINTI